MTLVPPLPTTANTLVLRSYESNFPQCHYLAQHAFSWKVLRSFDEFSPEWEKIIILRGIVLHFSGRYS